ncbi:MAG: Na/Pi symporter, partial [Clostridia bacterium]
FIGLYIVNNAIPFVLTKIDLKLFKNCNLYSLFFITALLTAVCQSSSLISVLIVTIASFGLLDIDSAVVMIMATNLGTCSTPFLASIGKSKLGLKVAIFNILFNFVGVFLNSFLYFTGLLSSFFETTIPLDTKVALFHTFYNISTTLLIFPYIYWFDHIKIGKKQYLFYEI